MVSGTADGVYQLMTIRFQFILLTKSNSAYNGVYKEGGGAEGMVVGGATGMVVDGAATDTGTLVEVFF